MTEQSRERRLPFALTALTFGLLTTGGTIPIPLYALWSKDFGFGPETITWIFAIYVVGTLLALVFFGGLSDQLGRKPLAVAALAITVVSTLLFVVAANVPMLLIARFLSGVGVGLVTSAATAALAELYAGENAAYPAMVSTLANMGGLGLGPLAAGIFAEYLPSPARLIFVVFGVAVLIITVAYLVAVPESNPRPPDLTVSWAPRVGVPVTALGVYLRSAAAVFPTFTLLGLFSSLTPKFLSQSLGVPNLAVAGLATFVLFEVGVVAQLVAHRLSHHRSILLGLPLLIVALGAVLAGIRLANLPLFGLGTVVGGVGAGLAFVGGLGQLSEAVPHEVHAKAVAAYFIAAQAGLAIPVVAIGMLTRAMSLGDAATLVVGFVLALAALALVVNLVGRRTTGPSGAARHRG